MNIGLGGYLEREEMSICEFADRIGVSPAAVSRWVAGVRVPRPAVMARIRRATGGAVTADSFYPAEPKPDI